MNTLAQAQLAVTAHLQEMAELQRAGWHPLTIGPHPIGFGKEDMERIRDAVWPRTPYPQALPWRVPPAWVEKWATEWRRYHQETKHDRRQSDSDRGARVRPEEAGRQVEEAAAPAGD